MFKAVYRFRRCTFSLWLALAALLADAPSPARAADDWKFDAVRLKNGAVFPGLLLEESPSEVHFRCVRRAPGSPTVVITTTFRLEEIARIDRLTPAERERLAERLRALDPTGKGESQRMDGLEIKAVPWLRPAKGQGLEYASAHFTLASDAREDIVRRAAVRLEEIYTAYGRFLPPRRRPATPTRIFLLRSVDEYQALLRDQHRQVLNPAFYDPGRNQIWCASNLEQLGEDLEKARKVHREAWEELRQLEADAERQYRGKIPAALAEALASKRHRIQVANAKNDTVFRHETRDLFRTLYHEAFHAYLAEYVYPPGEAEVPRWLNEGLAQIFESTVVEAGELRVGHAEAARLDRARAAVRNCEWPSLSSLLQAGPKEFLVSHVSDRRGSERCYLQSWALAFYLTFERHLLGTTALDRYVLALKEGADPVAAFEELVGEPLSRFEEGFQQYVLALRSDGTIAPPTPKRSVGLR